jgi:hypothetical protein
MLNPESLDGAQSMSVRRRRKPSPIRPFTLGGYAIEGPFYRRRSAIVRAADRFLFGLGA